MYGNSRYFAKSAPADHVGEHAERRADHHRGHDRESVEAVGEVHGIARSDDHEVRQQHEAEHAERIGDVLEERHDQVGARRQVDVEAAGEPLPHQHPDLVGRRRGDREREIERGGQADHRLPEVLLPRAHALRIAMDDLAVVVDPADPAETERHDQRHPHEAVGEVGPQQRGRRRSRSGSARRPSSACRSSPRCDCGPSLRTAWPIFSAVSRRITHGPAARPISSAVAAASTARNVRYEKTLNARMSCASHSNNSSNT